ncbi:MAG: fatty acid desaturase [Gammaproteobacteria bacterium]|nr:fatty acid desaturase [Gammaproteobacteria bacterium]
MLYGLLHLSFWGYVIATLILTHITVISVTLYLHRGQAHRAMDLHPIISHFFRFWLWMTTGMKTKEWVSIHRKHHAKCETTEDPHSPVIFGINKVFWEGAELYGIEAKNLETQERYGHGCPDDWIERHLYTPYSKLGVSMMLVIDLVLFGIPGLTVWALQMIWIPLFAAGVINGIGHYWGYRNFECPDASRNVVPWSILTVGEELHNNHHTFGSSAKFSVKWWEFDLGWLYISLLKAVGLVKIRKTIPELQSIPDKCTIDVETLKAFITNRFQIMSTYANEVIIPVFEREKAQLSSTSANLLAKAKVLLIRDSSLVSPEGKNTLMQILNERVQLNLVYEYRMKLQAIWDKTTATQKELLDALQEWCHQAESTGVDVLHQFANRLRGFSAGTQSV